MTECLQRLVVALEPVRSRRRTATGDEAREVVLDVDDTIPHLGVDRALHALDLGHDRRLMFRRANLPDVGEPSGVHA